MIEFFSAAQNATIKILYCLELLHISLSSIAKKKEQYNNLLNTRAFIMIINARLSKICLTRLIWPSRDMHEDTVETIQPPSSRSRCSTSPASTAGTCHKVKFWGELFHAMANL